MNNEIIKYSFYDHFKLKVSIIQIEIYNKPFKIFFYSISVLHYNFNIF